VLSLTVQNKLLVWKVIPVQHITLGFIKLPNQTLCTKGLHIQISLLKNYVFQMCTLSYNTPLCSLTVKLPMTIHRNTTIIATVSYWIQAIRSSVVWRCANIFSFKVSPTISSLELLSQATVVAITQHQVAKWCDLEVTS
jgi:hypothetical protein